MTDHVPVSSNVRFLQFKRRHSSAALALSSPGVPISIVGSTNLKSVTQFLAEQIGSTFLLGKRPANAAFKSAKDWTTCFFELNGAPADVRGSVW